MGNKYSVTDHCLKMPYISNLCKHPAIQQDDSSRPFYLSIVNEGIPETYKTYGPQDSYSSKTSKTKPNHVIIVGAGAAGLSAAYELVRAGQNVTIIERQNRVGGRIKTIKNGFSHGLKCEGGAMRIPDDHYLTYAYIKKFGVKMRPFSNKNNKGILQIIGHDPITIQEWENNNEKYSNLFFKGWDTNIPPEERKNIKGIRDYFAKTIAPVKEELFKNLEQPHANPKKVWDQWVQKWSVLSLEDFLRTDRFQDENGPKYRPWSGEAFYGQVITSYNPMYNVNLVELLRDELGEWWSDHLATPVEGMSAIAEGFIDPAVNGKIDLSDKIKFGYKVTTIKREGISRVKVIAKNVISGNHIELHGDAVIVTVTLPIIRQMDIDLDIKRQTALAKIHYEPSTKILLQCRTRFWEKQLGRGGFSKTNLPIGQIHYPSEGDPIDPENQRGILVIYTWGQDALLFSSQEPKAAISSAIEQVKVIHPEIEKEFEVGVVQAWYSDPTAQGAFVGLLPHQYCDGLKVLMKHPNQDDPIYLAGEALSFTNGWIQGAIESGLRSAYTFYGNRCVN